MRAALQTVAFKGAVVAGRLSFARNSMAFGKVKAKRSNAAKRVR